MSTLEGLDLRVDDGRRTLLEPTTLALETGQLHVAHGDSAAAHTVLALALAGRLEPTSGLVRLDHDPAPGPLQEAVVLVDVPGVTAPSDDLRLVDVAAEELALSGEPAGRAAVLAWLEKYGVGDQARTRMDALSAPARLRALTLLGACRHGARFLVVVRPDRTGNLGDAWLPGLLELTGAGFGVLVTTSTETAGRISDAPADVPLTALGTSRTLRERRLGRTAR